MASVAPQTTRRLLQLGLLTGFLALGLVGAGLAGCSGGKNLSASGTSGELPDSEVEDFSVTETDSGRPQWTLFAKHAATYQARDLVTARTLRIDFFDEKDQKTSELIAREGELYQRTRDLVARGNVVLLTTEGWRMSTEEMHFLNSRRKITSDKLVRVEKEGTILEGVGFESDPNLQHFEFQHQIRATVQPGAGALAEPKKDAKQAPGQGAQVTELLPEAPAVKPVATDGLVAEGLVRYYGKWRVVQGVSLNVRRGEVVGLLGPNGAGKSTTFHMIVGLLGPNEGTISLDGRDITNEPVYRRARLGLGYLAQEPSIFRKLTVRENVMAVLETMPFTHRQREERLEELLADLNLTHLAKRHAHKLSGGERRRVEITRALSRQPSFLLLDEPFVGIDPIAVEEIQEIIGRLRARGLGLLITDHNVRVTLNTTDRSYIMFDGRIQLSGSPQELAENALARQYYLGEGFTL